MMQNQNVIHHTESITEMQICLLLFIYILSNSWTDIFAYGKNLTDEDGTLGTKFNDFSQALIFLMLLEHIMTYIFAFVKRADIKKRGIPNESGIESTSLSRILGCISLTMELIIAILTVVHIGTMGDKMHELPLTSYFLLVNVLVTILLTPFEYLWKTQSVKSEIMKNIFTLYAVQRDKLRQRRDDMKEDFDRLKARGYFEQAEQDEAEPAEEGKKKYKPGFYYSKLGKMEKKNKKKVRSNVQEMQDRINQEVRKDEKNDETTDSDVDETTTSSDEDADIKKESRSQVVIREEDYMLVEEVKFSNDVYSYTICANMTKCCSPQ